MKFFKRNAFFLGLFLVALIIGGVILSITKKGDSIIFFCQNRSTFGNYFFIYGTQLGEELSYLFAVILLLFIRFKDALLVPFVALTTMLASYSLKSFFALPRPKDWFAIQNRMEDINLIVEPYVGFNSFPSGHAMSGFALFGLLSFVLSRKSKWFSLLFFIPAIIVAVSRIYLVNHFLMDVYLGSILGVAIALLLIAISNKIKLEPDHFLERSLLKKKAQGERA